MAAAQAAMEARSAVSNLEQAALDADQTFQAAKKNLVTTAAALRALDDKFRGSLSLDAGYQSAKSDIEVAVAKATAAQGAVSALQNEKSVQDVEKATLHFALRSDRDWTVTTPLVVALQDGRVMAVTSGQEAASPPEISGLEMIDSGLASMPGR